MATLRSRARKFPVPGEPGAWFAFRRLSERELETRADLKTDTFSGLDNDARRELMYRWLEATLVEWSYDDPCTDEIVRSDLDRPTLVWAFTKAIAHTLAIESLEEKKSDSPASTDTSTTIPASPLPTNGSSA